MCCACGPPVAKSKSPSARHTVTLFHVAAVPNDTRPQPHRNSAPAGHHDDVCHAGSGPVHVGAAGVGEPEQCTLRTQQARSASSATAAPNGSRNTRSIRGIASRPGHRKHQSAGGCTEVGLGRVVQPPPSRLRGDSNGRTRQQQHFASARAAQARAAVRWSHRVAPTNPPPACVWEARAARTRGEQQARAETACLGRTPRARVRARQGAFALRERRGCVAATPP